MVFLMTFETVFQSFLQNNTQCFTHSVHGRYRCCMMIGPFFASPIIFDQGQIQKPALHLSLSTVQNVYSSLTKSDRGKSGRCTQTLLGTGIEGVDAPFVN